LHTIFLTALLQGPRCADLPRFGRYGINVRWVVGSGRARIRTIHHLHLFTLDFTVNFRESDLLPFCQQRSSLGKLTLDRMELEMTSGAWSSPSNVCPRCTRKHIESPVNPIIVTRFNLHSTPALRVLNHTWPENHIFSTLPNRLKAPTSPTSTPYHLLSPSTTQHQVCDDIHHYRYGHLSARLQPRFNLAAPSTVVTLPLSRASQVPAPVKSARIRPMETRPPNESSRAATPSSSHKRDFKLLAHASSPRVQQTPHRPPGNKTTKTSTVIKQQLVK
jgi:hypothetical protein